MPLGTLPSFITNGLFGWMGKHGRHVLFGSPVQVSGGDYGSTDQDGATGYAVAYPQLVTLFDPNTGKPVNSSAQGAPYAATPLGYQPITDTTVQALTVPGGATYAVVTAEAQASRYRDDGTNPTATVGMPLAVGQSVTLGGAAEMAAIRFISQVSGGIINVSYYK